MMTYSPAGQLLLADMGVPMIVFTLPMMLILLIPVIAIESFLCKRWLGLTTRQAVRSNALSNVVSTLVGVPVAWVIMVVIEVASGALLDKIPGIDNWHSPLASAVGFILSSAWIGPPEVTSIWIIPAACLVLLVPFFFASYWIEYRIVKSELAKPEGGPKDLAHSRVRIAVRNANLITYGAMFIATSVWLLVKLPHR